MAIENVRVVPTELFNSLFSFASSTIYRFVHHVSVYFSTCLSTLFIARDTVELNVSADEQFSCLLFYLLQSCVSVTCILIDLVELTYSITKQTLSARF